MARVGVLLSGCGVFDGAEIHEAVLTLLFLERRGAEAVCMAPNIGQLHVVNHLTGDPAEGEDRNVLVESARIARGRIRDLAGVKAHELDALILPGGYGAAKNLSDFAAKGAGMSVHPEVEQLVRAMAEANKPIGFLCIAPPIAAKVLADRRPTVTIGSDPDTAAAIEKLGGKHQVCPATDAVVDRANKIVSTPAYMTAGNIAELAEGIEKLVNGVLDLLA
jgi:enhancing lycopene biosynthesis protein 2